MATLLNVHQFCPDECSMLKRTQRLVAELWIRDILVPIRTNDLRIRIRKNK